MTISTLLQAYPFAATRNVFTGEVIPNSTWYNEILIGWRYRFGKQLLDDMLEVWKTYNEDMKDRFVVHQVKEKFGSLRIYTSICTREMMDVIDKYEELSAHVCMNCGNDAEIDWNRNWVLPLCKLCNAYKGTLD